MDETLTLISVRTDHATSVRAGKSIFQSGIIKLVYVAEKDIRRAWEQFKKYKDKEYSFTDATSFVVMKDLGIRRVFSFDADFVGAGFEVVS